MAGAIVAVYGYRYYDSLMPAAAIAKGCTSLYKETCGMAIGCIGALRLFVRSLLATGQLTCLPGLHHPAKTNSYINIKRYSAFRIFYWRDA